MRPGSCVVTTKEMRLMSAQKNHRGEHLDLLAHLARKGAPITGKGLFKQTDDRYIWNAVAGENPNETIYSWKPRAVEFKVITGGKDGKL